ncbi:unnamed protein product [Euphydryas editha]|uniref:Uncharacterized protein n=1 Tax=Euphydryas editha TaxID=104508 RepID=A0AAU9TP37_EUPED|nr:unnamed protein product [Euphydryas editha]
MDHIELESENRVQEDQQIKMEVINEIVGLEDSYNVSQRPSTSNTSIVCGPVEQSFTPRKSVSLPRVCQSSCLDEKCKESLETIVTNMIGQIDLEKFESSPKIGGQRNKKMMPKEVLGDQDIQDRYDEANGGIYLDEIKESCFIEGKNEKKIRKQGYQTGRNYPSIIIIQPSVASEIQDLEILEFQPLLEPDKDENVVACSSDLEAVGNLKNYTPKKFVFNTPKSGQNKRRKLSEDLQRAQSDKEQAMAAYFRAKAEKVELVTLKLKLEIEQ